MSFLMRHDRSGRSWLGLTSKVSILLCRAVLVPNMAHNIIEAMHPDEHDIEREPTKRLQ